MKITDQEMEKYTLSILSREPFKKEYTVKDTLTIGFIELNGMDTVKIEQFRQTGPSVTLLNMFRVALALYKHSDEQVQLFETPETIEEIPEALSIFWSQFTDAAQMVLMKKYSEFITLLDALSEEVFKGNFTEGGGEV